MTLRPSLSESAAKTDLLTTISIFHQLISDHKLCYIIVKSEWKILKSVYKVSTWNVRSEKCEWEIDQGQYTNPSARLLYRQAEQNYDFTGWKRKLQNYTQRRHRRGTQVQTIVEWRGTGLFLEFSFDISRAKSQPEKSHTLTQAHTSLQLLSTIAARLLTRLNLLKWFEL